MNDREALARDAIRRGLDALGTQDFLMARRWFDRARRIVPADPSVGLLLASASARSDSLEASRLLHDVLHVHPGFAPARLALIALTSSQRDVQAAADLLHAHLSRAAPPSGQAFRDLARRVTEHSHRPGWIGANHEGRIACWARQRSKILVQLDGTRIAPRLSDGVSTCTLPSSWRERSVLSATIDGAHLIGSPVQLRCLSKTEGFVEWTAEGNIRGWAWCAADIDAEPRLVVTGTAISVTASAGPAHPVLSTGGTRPRGFEIAGYALPPKGPIRVCGLDGVDLTGSPLPARSLTADDGRGGISAARVDQPPSLLGEIAVAGSRRRQDRPVDIVILATEDRSGVSRQVASIIRNAPDGSRAMIVSKMAEDAQAGILTLLVPQTAGTPQAANLAIRHLLDTASFPRDIVLLKGSAIPPEHWVRRLAVSAHARADIGSVSALPCTPNRNQGLAAANTRTLVELPAATGSCIFFKHGCIATVAPFREDIFAQGGGEEIEWSIRARAQGWRHMADPALCIDISASASVSGARALLIDRNMALIERLHPGAASTLSADWAADPLAPSRRRADAYRWSRARSRKGAAILITHGRGGGVARFVRERAISIRTQGLRPIIITPAPGDSAAEKSIVLADDGAGYDDLVFDTDHALHELAAFLGPDKPAHVEIHHLLGHSPAIVGLAARLGIGFDLYIHDYALVCRRITLCGPGGQYCGQPLEATICDACTQALGDRLRDGVSTAALRTGSAHLVRLAKSVHVPTRDVADRLGRYVSCEGKLVVQPWQDDGNLPAINRPAPSGRSGDEIRVCVVGAIGQDKGIDILLGCASDAARRMLPIHFTIIGHTTDDATLIDTGRAFVTGEYDEDEALALIAQHRCTIGFLPSVWPETWCYGLTLLWRAGLWPVAFDLGSPAERIARRGLGSLIPLSLSPKGINDFLLAV